MHLHTKKACCEHFLGSPQTSGNIPSRLWHKYIYNNNRARQTSLTERMSPSPATDVAEGTDRSRFCYPPWRISLLLTGERKYEPEAYFNPVIEEYTTITRGKAHLLPRVRSALVTRRFDEGSLPLTFFFLPLVTSVFFVSHCHSHGSNHGDGRQRAVDRMMVVERGEDWQKWSKCRFQYRQGFTKTTQDIYRFYEDTAFGAPEAVNLNALVNVVGLIFD